MVVQVAGNSSGTGVRFNLGEFDDLRVLAGIVVDSTDDNAIVAIGSNQEVVVRGYVTAVDSLGDAIVMGDNGTDRGHRVVNSGDIRADDTAIAFEGFACTVENSGLIEGRYGIYFLIGTSTDTTSRIENSGVIAGGFVGIYHLNLENIVIENTGLIMGDTAAIDSSSSRMVLLNRGTIIGDVNLGGGNDVYDGREGTITAGIVAGEEGDDVFRPGRGVETIDGGLGTDTLDFRLGPGTRVSLAGTAQNSQTAFADTYLGIENILGSRNGNDVLLADDAANVLRSYGGRDRLSGGAGDDTLAGGAEIDTLTGGMGDDRFEFRARTEGGDRITDFAGAPGNNDTIAIVAAAFGGGLVAGALAASRFVTRANNVAQDANDRFIFRTTDDTLWFDQNGDRAGGLTLVADLQDGAVLTAADIILI